MLYYNIEVPYVCSGDNLGRMPGVSYLLRSSGAFFMRRTFRDDPLYRAIFTEYMNQLVSDKAVLEFFPEGTRSRTNTMLPPKFGIIQILTDAFFRGNAEEVTFIPVTINYTRCLEDSSFPGELTGEKKIAESVSRIVAAANVFLMNFGSIYIDFAQPINCSEATSKMKLADPEFNPLTKREDKLKFNNEVGYRLIFALQKATRIMPSTLVSTILLLYRKGIS